MKKVLYDIGGGFKEPIKALQVGGPLGGVIPINEVEKLNLDFQEFTAAGFMLGHASIATTRVYLEIGDQTLREIYHRAQKQIPLMEEFYSEEEIESHEVQIISTE